jgi:hypothetical protein
MDAGAFLAELDRDNARALERIASAAAREPSGEVTVPKLLHLALKNELEATECAAMWIATTREIDVKLALPHPAGSPLQRPSPPLPPRRRFTSATLILHESLQPLPLVGGGEDELGEHLPATVLEVEYRFFPDLLTIGAGV